jgi:hypothetical protein
MEADLNQPISAEKEILVVDFEIVGVETGLQPDLES